LANEFVVKEKGIGQPAGTAVIPITPGQRSGSAKKVTEENNKRVIENATNEALKEVLNNPNLTDEVIQNVIDAAKGGVLSTVTASGIALGESGTIGATSIANRIGAFDTAAIAAAALTQIVKPSAIAAGESGIIGGRSITGQAQTIINNYIEGTVISQTDLGQMILDQQYEYQRSGGKLTYNQIAI